jgi:hypothetical protein
MILFNQVPLSTEQKNHDQLLIGKVVMVARLIADESKRV